MAPKQQATLGSFFGNPNGTKATPQQAKLKFSSKAGTKAKKEAPSQDASLGAEAPQGTNGTNGHVKGEDVKMEDAALVKAEAEEEDTAPVMKEPGSASSSKKRTASRVSEEDDEAREEEAPPAKKQRQKPASEPKPKKGVATKKKANKATGTSKSKDAEIDDVDEVQPSKSAKVEPELTQDSDAEEDDVPIQSRKRSKPTKSPPTKSARVEPASTQESNAEEDDEPVQSKKRSKLTNPSPAKSTPAKSKPATKATKTAVVEDEDDAAANSEPDSVAEAEASEDEADEKPAVSAKIRAKMQSTLKSIAKDAYPDWKAGDPVPYAALCTTFSKIEMTTKRLEILALCATFLRQVLRLTPEDLLPTTLLMIGKLAADYAGVELGIGESLIMKAICETTGRSLKIVKEDQQKIGDLGLVAAKSRSNQPTMFKPKPLTVRGIHEGLMKIATTEGQGAQGRKVDGIKKLLSAADVGLAKGQTVDINENKGGPSESKFIIRALEGKMRLGLADKNLQVALAHAMVFHSVAKDGKKVPNDTELKKGEEVFKSVYNELPSYEVIVPALLKGGIWKLRETCKLQPGVPLKPMLAKPTKSLGEVLDRFEGKDFTCEYKYDGERAQIHFVSHDADEEYASTVAPKEGKSDRGVSNIFSRNSEDLSKKYPDILAKLPSWVKQGTKSFVLDCETVAWDIEKKHVLPFQQLMTRKKKDVKLEDVKVKVCVFAFDILYLNGEALVNLPFRERRERMYSAFDEAEGEFTFAKYGNTKEIEEIQLLLEDSVKASCEGLMVKMLDGVESHYEPSRRSQNWLKVKKDYLSGAGDSLDLVVLGAYYGKGKRTSVYGAFLLACYNSSTEKYESVCNIGTGFSEALLTELHATFSPLVIDRPKPFYDHSTGKNDQPDVWFEPRFVWEVLTADLTLSPRYRAAASEVGDGTHKGISLRFPRLVRVRDDKKPDGATTSKQVAEMYHTQEAVGKEKKTGIDDDFEY